MNRTINTLTEHGITQFWVNTNPALLHNTLWKLLEQALKAVPNIYPLSHKLASLKIYAEIDALAYFDQTDTRLAATLGKAFFEMRSNQDIEAFWKLLLIKQLLFELSTRTVASVMTAPPPTPPPPSAPLHTTRPTLHISLGVLCKETDQLKHDVVLALQKLTHHLENQGLENTLHTQHLLMELYNAVWSGEPSTDIEAQIFYANSLYDALPEVQRAQGLPATHQWLSLFTWLYGDKDGRPYDTNQHTEILVLALENTIVKRYLKDIEFLIKEQAQNNEPAAQELATLGARLDKKHPTAFKTPDEMIAALQHVRTINPSAIDTLIMRVKAFGFHYLEIEFRENAKMFSRVVNEILSRDALDALGKIYPNDALSYQQMNKAERQQLLMLLLDDASLAHAEQLSPASLWQQYLQRTEKVYEEKSRRYAGKDYLILLEQDPDYISMYDARNAVARFELIDTYRDRMKIHGIAEYSSHISVFEVLFLMRAAQVRDGIDIALQPEDLAGAERTLQTVHQLYENPLYRKHLQTRGNRQYITFGPSDMGKQGGKGMHKLNMVMSNQHQHIAAQYGIDLVPHIIMGVEHARCNGVIPEIMQEFGALWSSETRFMLAGCAEMRASLLSKRQATHFLTQIFGMHAHEKTEYRQETIQANLSKWHAVVRHYQTTFFEHPALPNLLKRIARFDLVLATAKGTRPPSRIFNIPVFESRPDAIRAIPWTRALLAGGIHSELIGVAQFSDQPAVQLHAAFQEDASFQSFVKSMAYALARTNIKQAWLTLIGEVPTQSSILALANALKTERVGTAEQLLARLHLEMIEGKRFTYKAMNGCEPKDPWKLKKFKLLDRWPSLKTEVQTREKHLHIYRLFLIYSKSNPSFIRASSINDFYCGFLAASNIATAFVSPDVAAQFSW